MGVYILEGRWDKKYDNGTSPMKWVNSHEILQKFYKTKQRVKYGQCWVFAAIYQACLRALGIPSRIITNYGTVIDANGNLMRDWYLDKDGKIIDGEKTW